MQSAVQKWGFLTSMAALFLAGCSVNKSDVDDKSRNACGSEPIYITEQRYQAFHQTVRPLMFGGRCGQCHDGNSGKAPYPHTSADLIVGYKSAYQMIDFLNPLGSRMVRKLLANHNCGSDSQCKALAGSTGAAIGAWAQMENELPPPPACAGDLATGLKISMPGKTIDPSNLSKTKDTVLRWDLTELNSTVGKMLFSVNVKAFTDKSTNGLGTYLLSNLVLATANRRVMVKSVLPVINSRQAPQYGNFTGLNFVVDYQAFDPTASILGFPPLSDAPQQVAYEKNPEADSLGFVITIQETDDPASTSTKSPGCKAPAKFKLVYDNVFALQIPMNNEYVGQCTRCHGQIAPPSPANIVMNFGGNGVDPCTQALTRTKFEDPLNSLLLKKPSQQDESAAAGTPHPVKIDLLNDPAFNPQKSLILDWINAEKDAANQ